MWRSEALEAFRAMLPGHGVWADGPEHNENDGFWRVLGTMEDTGVGARRASFVRGKTWSRALQNARAKLERNDRRRRQLTRPKRAVSKRALKQLEFDFDI